MKNSSFLTSKEGWSVHLSKRPIEESRFSVKLFSCKTIFVSIKIAIQFQGQARVYTCMLVRTCGWRWQTRPASPPPVFLSNWGHRAFPPVHNHSSVLAQNWSKMDSKWSQNGAYHREVAVDLFYILKQPSLLADKRHFKWEHSSKTTGKAARSVENRSKISGKRLPCHRRLHHSSGFPPLATLGKTAIEMKIHRVLAQLQPFLINPQFLFKSAGF